MKIVQGSEIEKRQLDNIRGGEVFTRGLLHGEIGPENFSLVLYDADETFYSPRHHHTFDQYRYQLDGDADFDNDGKMPAGTLGYFPEGVYYGPTSASGKHTVAVFQFGGPSGCGYMDIDQVREAREALKQMGTFKDGVYHRNPGVEGKITQDAGEAIWEHVNQRPIVYPRPQYDKPIIMNTDHYPWRKLPTSTGVEQRTLGTFTSCQIVAAQYRLQPDASFEGVGRGIYLAESGAGRVGDEAMSELTAVYLEKDEVITFSAEKVTDLLYVGLPVLADMNDLSGQPQTASAAA